jgi:hypothetical protein
VFLVTAILYDVVSRRSVHRAYVWGRLLLIIERRIPVGATAAWQQAIAHAVIGEGS